MITFARLSEQFYALTAQWGIPWIVPTLVVMGIVVGVIVAYIAVAAMFLTTETAVTEIPKKEEPHMHGGGMGGMGGMM